MKCVSKPQIKMYSSQRNVFEFKDIVLDWEISSILQHDGDFNCLERAATFSGSSAYFNGLKPLILAESWATLKEDLIRYKQGEIKGSELQVRKLQTRRSGPQTITMRGSIRKFDPKLEMVVLKSSSREEFLGRLKIQDHQIMREYQSQKIITCASQRNVLHGETFQVFQLSSLVTLNRAYEVCCLQPRIRFRSNLLGLDFQGSKKSIKIDIETTLNAPQNEAVNEFLNLQHGLKLVQGPPGTGKTTMIIQLLAQLVKHGEYVMVCAASNKAVQVIAKRFLDGYPTIPMIFAGREEKLDPSIESIFLGTWQKQITEQFKVAHSFVEDMINLGNIGNEPNQESILEVKKKVDEILLKLVAYSIPIATSSLQSAILQCSEAKNLKQKLDALSDVSRNLLKLSYSIGQMNNEVVEKYLLRGSKVLFCTLSFSGQYRKQSFRTDTLIVDEAAQATEADTIIPFQHEPNKCLLVGDTNQLPAIVQSQLARNNHYDWSMMYRLQVETGFPCSMLNI